MSSEKRKKSRIQGGWANVVSKPHPVSSRCIAEQRPDTNHYGSSFHAAKISAGQNEDFGASTTDSLTTSLIGKATVPSVTPKFTFQTDAGGLKKEPLTKTIEEAGNYIISTEPSGISRIHLMLNFIEPSECDWIFELLHDEVPWIQQTVTKAGETYLQPRMTAWFGEHPYSYSGISHDQNAKWTPVITMLKDRIEEVTGYTFNSVLANLYRDGHDHVSWHSDDEISLGVQPVIASLSFGDSRNFELRKKLSQVVPDSDDLEYIKIPLDAGSLLIMEGCVQQDWQHQIPKEYHDRGPRINLTYRTILPP